MKTHKICTMHNYASRPLMPPHDHRNITNLHISQHSSPLEIHNLAALFHLVIHSATLLLRRCPKFPWAQRGKYHSGIELPARPQKDNPSSWQSPRLRSVLRKQRDVILCNREERMGDKDKVKHKHSLCKCLSKRMHFLPSSTHLTSRTSPLGMFLTIFLGLSLGSGKVFGVLISSTSVSAMEREILGTGAAVRLTGANAEHAAMATRRRATVKERIVGWWYVMRYGRVVASQSSGHRQQSSSSRKATSTTISPQSSESSMRAYFSSQNQSANPLRLFPLAQPNAIAI